MARNTISILLTTAVTVFLVAACSTSDKKAESNSVAKTGPVKQAPIKPKLSQTDRMMRVALKMRGKPYSYNGSTPKGFDASGLVYYSHKRVGLEIPRSFRQQFEQSKSIAKNNVRPGDLLFFAVGTGKPNHVGIYLGSKKFVHMPPTGGKVIMSDVRSKRWAEVLVRGGRL